MLAVAIAAAARVRTATSTTEQEVPPVKHTMNRKVIITCALTGAGDTVGKSEHVPVTPEQIAESGIEAARAGAAIVHVHVRDPAHRRRLARGGALPRGRRADPRGATST